MTVPYRFETSWKVVALVVVLLPLLLRLGVWQMERAEEKRQLENLYASRQSGAPIDQAQLASLGSDAEVLAYLRVSLAGELDNERVVLLDNSIRDGVPGYEVLQLLHTRAGTAYLLNRGWLPGFADRQQLPSVEPVTLARDFIGTIYVPAGAAFLLKADTVDSKPDDIIWPVVVQSIDIERISALFDVSLFPYSVRLETGQISAFRTDWAAVSTSPEKHWGYAVQWFCMAIALVVFFLFSSMQRIPDATRYL